MSRRIKKVIDRPTGYEPASNPGLRGLVHSGSTVFEGSKGINSWWGERGITFWVLYGVGVFIVAMGVLWLSTAQISLATFLVALWCAIAIFFLSWLWNRANEARTMKVGWGMTYKEEVLDKEIEQRDKS